MGKYKYDKTALKGLSIGPFLGLPKNRKKKLSEGENEIPKSWFNVNEVGKSLHPGVQHVKIKEVKEYKNAKKFVFVPNTQKGTDKLAYFRAGQYISIEMDVNGIPTNKPYSLCSSPKDALGKNGIYEVTIKNNPNGFASKHVNSTWKVGDEFRISGPLGEFYYSKLRDAKTVVAIAGGSGITPFVSMARAIADGVEDFNLTILYGVNTQAEILLKDKLDDAVKRSKGKVKVVYVLAKEKKPDCETGFINAAIIKKFAPKDSYSVFICGPEGLHKFLEGELKTFKLEKKFVRKESNSDFHNPEVYKEYDKNNLNKIFKLTLLIRGERKVVDCLANEPILWAIEKAKINAPSHCRGGECGWCHSRLIKGNVFVPQDRDGRRMGDKKFGWIHPCCTFATSDVEVEIFPILKHK